MDCGGGCSFIDSDKDGVEDCMDFCPNSQCNIVDARGCETDLDNDGVADCEDDCPDKKGDASNRGCPRTTPLLYVLGLVFLFIFLVTVRLINKKVREKRTHPNLPKANLPKANLPKANPQTANPPTANPPTADLLTALRDRDKYVRVEAVRSLGRKGPNAKEAIPALIEALKSNDPRIVESVKEALEATTR
ncbi:MAG: HEAT repeat domain-containing protein [Candidatus Methanofastidiosia archaeon]